MGVVIPKSRRAAVLPRSWSPNQPKKSRRRRGGGCVIYTPAGPAAGNRQNGRGGGLPAKLTLWQKLADDRDLIALKATLLCALMLLAAAIERVV